MGIHLYKSQELVGKAKHWKRYFYALQKELTAQTHEKGIRKDICLIKSLGNPCSKAFDKRC